MSAGAIIYLIILLTFFIGGFIFFIFMEFKMHKNKKENKKIKSKKTK